MLSAYEKTYASKSRKSNFGQWQRYAALREIMSPSLSEDGLYDMFIDGRRPGDPPVKAEESSPHLGQGAGWLFALNLGGPTVRVAAATYLLEHDQRDMAAFLLDYRSYGLSHQSPDSYSANLDLMQADFEVRRDHWKARIDQAAQSLRALAKKAGTSSPGKSAARPDLPEPYTVHTLAVRYRRDQASSRSQSPHPPNKIDFPVDRRQVVRYEEEAGEHMIIYASSALESPGEVPAEGYWFQSTRDRGKTWERPVYLGLQQYFPYVVVPNSNLPLLNGDTLNVEVRRREIDPASITFPPVGLSFKQDQGNLYLSFDLATLLRDSDSDGFTDLVERHLGLNPDSADSDGDGIDDYHDPLPLTAYSPGGSDDDKDFAYAVLHEIVGYDRQAIVVQPRQPGAKPNIEDLLALPNRPIEHGVMFLMADPKLFAGVKVPFRLLVYKSADDHPVGDGNAPFYPVQILNVFSRRDGSERFVIWSASWTGGSFVVRCKGGQCQTEVLSRWIT